MARTKTVETAVERLSNRDYIEPERGAEIGIS